MWKILAKSQAPKGGSSEVLFEGLNRKFQSITYFTSIIFCDYFL